MLDAASGHFDFGGGAGIEIPLHAGQRSPACSTSVSLNISGVPPLRQLSQPLSKLVEFRRGIHEPGVPSG